MNHPDALRAHYERLHALHGDAPQAVQYSDRASQEARFRVLAEIGPLDGSRVLDFGCGLAHMLDWVIDRGVRLSYTGVDIVPGFLASSAARHPGHRFCAWEDIAGESFDWAFVSGVFNNRMDDNWTFMTDTVRALMACTTRGVAFNAMSTWVDWQDPGLWYVEPERTFAFLKSLTPFVTLRNDYVVREVPVPFEFACYAYHTPTRAWV
jgi:SAM-dependent methyltransferase